MRRVPLSSLIGRITMELTQTALVTGATSGLGFEAAAQLAEEGYASVFITGRSEQSASKARDALVDRTKRDVFIPIVVDLNESGSVARAVDWIVERNVRIGFLLLNAGMVSGSKKVLTDEGLEITHASSVVGHHQLTVGLLAGGALDDRASIVIAGSEAARGDVPTFKPTDLRTLATKSYGGDLTAAVVGRIRGEDTVKYRPATAYADAKALVAWWAAALSRRLPAGMTVNAVSPGSAPDTDADRNANFFMKRIMVPFFKIVPGMSQSVPEAANRYLTIGGNPPESGAFFASKPSKVVGPLEVVVAPHIVDRDYQEAGWEAIVEVTNGATYPVAA